MISRNMDSLSFIRYIASVMHDKYHDESISWEECDDELCREIRAWTEVYEADDRDWETNPCS